MDPPSSSDPSDATHGKKRRRWDDKTTTETTATTATAQQDVTNHSTSQQETQNDHANTNDAAAIQKAKILAMQQSIQARLKAAKEKLGVAGTSAGTGAVTTNKKDNQNVATTTATTSTTLTALPPAKRIKTHTHAISKARHSNPYLAHEDEESNEPAPDPRLARASKLRIRHKEVGAVEPGTWQEIAEKKRQIAAKAQASGFISGRKIGHTMHAASMGTSSYYGPSGPTSLEEHNDQPTDGSQTNGSNHQDKQQPEVTADWILPPRWDANPDATMPVALEWWDIELLPLQLRQKIANIESEALQQQNKSALETIGSKTTTITTTTTSTTIEVASPPNNKTETINNNHQVVNDADGDGDSKQEKHGNANIHDLRLHCQQQASISNSKTAALVQHIVPVRPPNAHAVPPKQAVLHLTKKERKRQRKMRRQEKQRELQDLQAAGLMPAPEPRLTLRNFIQVLGDQAYLDPSQMEQKVMEQMQARQRSHLNRNAASKLTKEQRAEKRARKLHEDTSQGVHVAVFWVKDMSHPYHRAKVDLNAQQYNLTGGVIECNPDEGNTDMVSCVIVEGGPKAIQRYIRLMTVRMKWTGPDDDPDHSDDDEMDDQSLDEAVKKNKFNPDNQCQLVWTGMAPKPSFHGFLFQSCETLSQARKVLKSKGVEHFWDQVLQHAHGQGAYVHLRLAGEIDAHDNPYLGALEQNEDIVMQDTA